MQWSSSVLHQGRLESVIDAIQMSYYPEMLDKVSYLFFAIIKDHPFVDGNKRTAIMASECLLSMNGIDIPDFIIKYEDIAV